MTTANEPIGISAHSCGRGAPSFSEAWRLRLIASMQSRHAGRPDAIRLVEKQPIKNAVYVVVSWFSKGSPGKVDRIFVKLLHVFVGECYSVSDIQKLSPLVIRSVVSSAFIFADRACSRHVKQGESMTAVFKNVRSVSEIIKSTRWKHKLVVAMDLLDVAPNPWKPENSDERIPIGPPDTISKFKGDL
tara:strand:- start:151 stop:714 length:564 start_codon:yes stop_codon:yes gene_type:complete